MNEKDRLGRFFRIDYDLGEEVRQAALNAVVADARANLPEGVVFEVRRCENPKEEGVVNEFGRTIKPRSYMAENWGIGWHRKPEDPEYPEVADVLIARMEA